MVFDENIFEVGKGIKISISLNKLIKIIFDIAI